MKKKVIGIDLNEVVRAHWSAVESYYEKHMKEINDEVVITKPFNTYNYLNHFSFPERIENVKYLKKDIPDIDPKDYQLDRSGRSKADPLLFDIIQEKRTPEQRLNAFLYEEYLLELFGNCGKVYSSVINDIHEFYSKNKDKYDFIIVSLEQPRSVMPTLFFISKVGFQLPQYYFSSYPENIWDKVDILITANPEMIKAKPFHKNVICIDREFNRDCKVAHRFANMSEVKHVTIENTNLILFKLKNYVKRLFKRK